MLATRVYEEIRPVRIPYGRYGGTWSGYRVQFDVDGTTYHADVTKAVRGLNVPVIVEVSEQGVSVGNA